MRELKLEDLKQQLEDSGATATQATGEMASDDLSDQETALVAGGFGQIIGFAQGFNETTGPGGFVQSFYQTV